MRIFEHVPAQFPASAPCLLAFVDEAPETTESCRGYPLQGPHGRLFNQALRLAGLCREEVLITHCFDYEFPGNDIRTICDKSGEAAALQTRHFPGGGALPDRSLSQFERLREELMASGPKVILPMGATATWCFTGSVKFADARGATSRATHILPGAKIVPTYRAVDVLGQYKLLGTWVADIKKALEEARRPEEEIARAPRELWIEPSLADMKEFAKRYLKKAEIITVDIETAKGQMTCIGFGADAEHAISIPFVDYRKPDRNYWPSLSDELQAWDWVRATLGCAVPKLFQNGPYDVWYFIRQGIYVRNWCRDTRLLHHSLYPELPKSLAYLGSVYTREGPWKLLGGFSKSHEKRDA